MLRDILERLRADPGSRTLGQLLQDREAAAFEIERLRSETDRLTLASSRRLSVDALKGVALTPRPQERPPFRRGTLIRVREVCEMLGISRSGVYRRLSDGTFPRPARLGLRTVRWRVDEIEDWRDAHS